MEVKKVNSMKTLSKTQLEAREKQYPVGARVELIYMDDEYNRTLHAGSMGTITRIDPYGDIEVDWDNGSRLKLIYGVDQFLVTK